MPEFELSLFIYGLAVGIGAGLFGGLMAGLAGVGGGLIYVPVFYALMPAQQEGMSAYIFASLVSIIITGFFSSRSHWHLGHVDKVSLSVLLPGLMLGAGLGLWSTLHVPGIWILFALAALNAWIAFDYSHPLKATTQPKTTLTLFSGPIGLISGMLGIGGGTMLVPLLRRSLPLRYAVGTSAVGGFSMAIAAVTINISLEADWSSILSAQWSFLLAAWLGIAVVLPHSIHWAAELHEHMSEAILRMILKTIFIALSASLLIAGLISLSRL